MLQQRVAKHTVAQAFDYLGMPQFTAAYADGGDHKAVAFAPRGSYPVFRAATVAAAEQRALEACQLQYRFAGALAWAEQRTRGK